MAIVGDAGLIGPEMDALRDSIMNEKIKSVILTGDNLYFGNYAWTWNNWKKSGINFDVVAIGNHHKGYENEIKYFGSPGEFYSVVKNGARFIVMNSDNQANLDAQFGWLQEELTKAQEVLIFLVYHHPTYTSGSDDHWRQREQFQLRMRSVFKSELAKKISAVFLGHAHISALINFGDIPAVISGSGREVLKAKPVSYMSEDTAVKSLYLAPQTQHWASLKISENATEAQIEFIRVADQARVCTAVIGNRKITLDANCNSDTRLPASAQTEESLKKKFPKLQSYPYLQKFVEANLKKNKDNKDLTQKDISLLSDSLANYFEFLGLDPSKTVKSPLSEEARTSFDRLLNSSTQFLLCEDLEDWACLEKVPLLKPSKKFRQETDESLGRLQKISRPLEPSLNYFFTNQFDLPREKRDASLFLSLKLADIIKSKKWNQISMALYGVDDVKKSMLPFYNALMDKIDEGTDVRGVFDSTGLVSKTPLIFSHRGDVTSEPNVFKKDSQGKIPLQFQYEDTPSLVESLNKNCRSEIETKARIEWPPSPDIMHNKFIVFQSDNESAVWTGTANISQTCMGEESNSNMSIFIKDKNISQAFLTEFNEMYDFQKESVKNPRYKPMEKDQLRGGRFHTEKRPNTQRYFQFSDNHELKLHFSPTDDGEHRVLLPLILSARKGDELRISMFGHGGVEFVRVLQLAAARGVKIRIFFDTATMYNSKSWIAQNSVFKLQDPNPFASSAEPIMILRNKWGNQNHHKTASLTRIEKNSSRVEYLVVGSQNWSKSGNDDNDENMITLRRKGDSIKAGEAFNRHFDERLWPNGVLPTMN